MCVFQGPSDKDREFYDLIDEDNNTIHHHLQGGLRKKHRDDTEDWETTKVGLTTFQLC